MVVDAWNPKTFGAEMTEALTHYSQQICGYHIEDQRLMNERLNDPRNQTFEENRFYSSYRELYEQVLIPILAKSRLRAWHYTRLTDNEADAMFERLLGSSLDFLSDRLHGLVAKKLLTQVEADTIFAQSPFHEQHEARAQRFWTTIIPLPHCSSRVTLLLESWGGESAYFWLSDEKIVAKLKRIGTPRIIEIETSLLDRFNSHKVAETVLNAWARQMGVPASLAGGDMHISGCINTAKVMRIHTQGDDTFDAVASTYPSNADTLLSSF